jgi:predicted phosphodiesterase
MELQEIAVDSKKSLFRIAHISDTHVSPEYNRVNIVRLKSLLSQVVDEDYDHVVITGDIAGNGEERDFRSVRRILKYFGLLEYNRLTVTVGNHDVFGGVHRAEDLLPFGSHCRTVNYAEKMSLFERAFKETFPKKAYESERIFPFVKIVGPAVFVGVNSVRPFHPILNPFGSNGHVSDRQLQATERILNHPSIDGLAKIVLIHHHFNKYEPYSDTLATKLYHLFESQTLALRGRKKVEEVFRRLRVNAVLHGHTHIEGVYTASGIIFSSTALNPIRNKTDKGKLSRINGLGFNDITVADGGRIEARKHSIMFQENRVPYSWSNEPLSEQMLSGKDE